MITLSRPLILASASPRRAALLTQVGIAFQVLPAHSEEPPPAQGEDIFEWAQRAAVDKARATANLLPHKPLLVLAADTVVVLPPSDGVGPQLHGHPVTILGKPRDADDAHAMLHRLSGRAHSVISAFALLTHSEGGVVTGVAETRVHFRHLTEAEIRDYVTTGEPLDKAGAYGIQARGAVLIDHITGDYYTVAGLPLTQVWQSLATWRV